MARWVMARPVAVLIPTLAFLLLLGTPFLRLEQGIPDASILPPGIESREAAVALSRDFRAGETSPIIVLADGRRLADRRGQRPADPDLAAGIDAVEGVDRVEGPFSSLRDPATGTDLDAAGIAALFAAPRDQLPPELAAGLARLEEAYLRDSTVRLDAISPLAPLSPDGTEVVPLVRAVAIEGVTTQVGGLAAEGRDFMTSQAETVPYAIALTLTASALILFLLFGSVVIPIKAVIMTLLSITASFGALVFIFQDGNFADVLGFQSPGFTVAGNPIIMFSVLFGLSMDYEVLLLSRIQEAYRRTGDNTGIGRRGPGQDGRGHHRRGADHGHRLRGLRPGRVDHDQEHRRRAWPSPSSSMRRSCASCWCPATMRLMGSGTGGPRARWAGSPTGSGSVTRRTTRTGPSATSAARLPVGPAALGSGQPVGGTRLGT